VSTEFEEVVIMPTLSSLSKEKKKGTREDGRGPLPAAARNRVQHNLPVPARWEGGRKGKGGGGGGGGSVKNIEITYVRIPTCTGGNGGGKKEEERN